MEEGVASFVNYTILSARSKDTVYRENHFKGGHMIEVYISNKPEHLETCDCGSPAAPHAEFLVGWKIFPHFLPMLCGHALKTRCTWIRVADPCLLLLDGAYLVREIGKSEACSERRWPVGSLKVRFCSELPSIVFCSPVSLESSGAIKSWLSCSLKEASWSIQG